VTHRLDWWDAGEGRKLGGRRFLSTGIKGGQQGRVKVLVERGDWGSMLTTVGRTKCRDRRRERGGDAELFLGK